MAFGSITFRGYMLTYSTYLTLAALPLATMPQKMLETATADPANTCVCGATWIRSLTATHHGTRRMCRAVTLRCL